MTAKITAKNACNKLLRRRTARKDCKIKNCSFLDPGCANLLILLFINDLPNNIRNKVFMFADDLKLEADATNINDISNDLIEQEN